LFLFPVLSVLPNSAIFLPFLVLSILPDTAIHAVIHTTMRGAEDTVVFTVK